MAIEVDSLFQAMDIILNERLKSISYDTTEICTIVDISNRKNGKYMVSPNNGETKYAAYSESTEYELEDLVRVSIPNGDYTQKKFIEGKYVDDDAVVPITYVSPLNSVIDVTGNLMENQYDTTFGLQSNSGVMRKTIWSMDLTKNARFKDLQASGIYNTISLSAQFKTLLDGYSIRTGSYGLQLDIYTKVSAESTLHTIRTVYLDSSEMFGDPYNFAIYTPQSKKFDLSALNAVTRVVLSFYQNGDFTYYNPKKQEITVDGNTITLEKGTIALNPLLIKNDNILIRNVKIGFGSDLSVIADNTLEIYTTNSPDYNLAELEETNEKKIGFLWYNKDENNQYLGFSDGIFDPDYDEVDYIKKSSADYRLLGQKGQDNVPTDKDSLELAADIAESESYLNNISNLISKDLIRVLNTYKSRVTTISKLVSALETTTENIQDSHSDFVEQRQRMIDVYKEFLSWNAAIQAEYQKREYGRKVEEVKASWNSYTEDADGEKIYTYPHLKDWWNSSHNPTVDLYGNVKSEIVKIQGFITKLLTDAQTIINEGFSGFQGVHDTYKIRLEKINSSLTEYLEELEQKGEDNPRLTDNLTLMKKYPKDSYVEYVQQDFSDDDNKYCIYWYRYDPTDTGEDYDEFAGAKWKRLLKEKDFNYESKTNKTVKNFGLPVEDEPVEIDGKQYYSSKTFDSDAMINQLMCGTRVEEKYKIVLFHNHQMYVSDELVFTNLDDIPDPTTVDKGDAIVITHGDKSQESYQSYGVDNYLTNSADKNIKRWLNLSYDGLLGGNEVLAGAQVYWYVPINATMLTVNDSDLTGNYGFSSDKSLETKPDYSRDGYICYYKMIKSKKVDSTTTTADPNDLNFYYKIKPYYMQTASQNTIVCKVIKGEYTFETDIFMTFSSYGTSGTDYTLITVPAGAQNAVYAGTPLKLNVSLYDYNNNEIPICGETPSVLTDAQTASGFKAEWVGPTAYDGEENVQYDDDGNVTGLTIKNNTNTDVYYGTLKTTVQFSISEDNDEAEDTTATGEESKFKSSRLVNLSTLYPLAYSAGDYYVEGATTIVYDSQGGNPVYYKDPYKIFNLNTNKEVTEELASNESLSWEIHYYKTGENNVPVEITQEDSDYTINMSFMPKLNDANGLAPSNMYMDNIDCYATVQCWRLERKQKKDLLWAQSIVILQNRYPSAMLNSWDGSLTIDEKNGTILSSMVGAGRKTVNNTFEGVLMGDIEVGAGIDLTGNKSGLGIYGFNDGAQSFGFNVDGTGFIGKSGRGRILFDGNEGTIASASYFQNHIKESGKKDQPETAGMLIDLDDGMIDMRGGANYDAWIDWQGLIKAEYLAKAKAATYNNKIAEETYEKIQEALAAKADIAAAYEAAVYRDYTDGKIDYKEVKKIEDKIAAMKKEGNAMGGVPEFETSFMIEYLEYEKCINENEKALLQQMEEYRIAVEEEYAKGHITQEQYQKAVQEANFCQFEKYQDYVDRYGELYRRHEASTRFQRGDEVPREIVDDIEKVIAEKEKKIAELQAELEAAEQELLETDMKKIFTEKESSGGSGGKKPDYILTGDREKFYELLDALEEKKIIEQQEYEKYLLSNPTQSNIHIDVKEPYFYIVSEQGKRLINIGADTAFDIKSYKQNPNEPKPFQGKGYYLKTNNYMPSTLNKKGQGDMGSGMLIDLAGNKIDAYDFSIKGESSSDYPGSYFSINSSPKKFMDIYYLPDESLRTDYGEGIHLFEMGMKDGEEIYRLRSYDWNLNDEEDPHGMEIDFAAGSVTIHPGWDICNIGEGGEHSGATQNQSIVIDSNHSTHPFQIGPVDKTVNGEPLRRFRIGWDGSITTPNFNVDSAGKLNATEGKIGGWNISESSLSSDAVTLSSATTGNVIRVANGVFNVTAGGGVTASNINISGTDSSINGVSISSCSISSGSIDSASISNGSIGTASINSCTLTSCTIADGGLTVGSDQITKNTIGFVQSITKVSVLTTTYQVVNSMTVNTTTVDDFFGLGGSDVVTGVTYKYTDLKIPYYLSVSYNVNTITALGLEGKAESKTSASHFWGSSEGGGEAPANA